MMSFADSKTCVMYKKSAICNDRVFQGGPWSKQGWECYTRDVCPGNPEPTLAKFARTSASKPVAEVQPPQYTKLLQYLLSNFGIEVTEHGNKLLNNISTNIFIDSALLTRILN